MPTTTSEKRAAFRRLHESGCFVIPNPWDVGSALYLQSLGFQALATTSAGFAWSRGAADGRVTREAALAHIAELSAAVDVPFNADFEGGFADRRRAWPKACACAWTTGVSGLSIEDFTGDRDTPLYDLDLAVARIAAARVAIDAAGGDVLLTGRSEGFIRGRPDLEETIRRLEAYAQAGADCLYAPGISTREQIAAVVQAVAPKPVNLLVGHAHRSHRHRLRRPRRAPHQRGRIAGARRLGRLHPRRQADQGGGQLQRLRRCRAGRGAQQDILEVNPSCMDGPRIRSGGAAGEQRSDPGPREVRLSCGRSRIASAQAPRLPR